VHKGRAVCSAVGEAIFGRLAAAVVEPIDRLRPARAFLTVSGMPGRATSKIDKIPKPIREPCMPRAPRRIDSPAQMREILLLAA
jgi:hypothetical protein